MDSSVPTAGAAQTRERIQEVAAKLFSERGYRGVGVAELGDAVGLGRGALYYHIGSKEELLFNIVVKYIEKLVLNGRDCRQSEPDPRIRVRKLSRYLMRIIAQNMPEMTLCFREADALMGQRRVIVANLHQQYQDVWKQTFKDGEDKGYFQPISTVALKGILGMYFHSFIWFNPNGNKTYEDVADIFSDMILAILDKRSTTQI